MSNDNSGPAFPSVSQEYGPVLGISVLDYFAAEAMKGMTANPYYDDYDFDKIASMAYAQARAMISERGR